MSSWHLDLVKLRKVACCDLVYIYLVYNGNKTWPKIYLGAETILILCNFKLVYKYYIIVKRISYGLDFKTYHFSIDLCNLDAQKIFKISFD